MSTVRGIFKGKNWEHCTSKVEAEKKLIFSFHLTVWVALAIGAANKIGAVAAGGLAGAASAPSLAVAGIQGLGFQTAGIITGTPAATLMSSYGGLVPAGSACATLQSIGAAGALGVGATVAVAAAGAYVGVKVVSSLAGTDSE